MTDDLLSMLDAAVRDERLSTGALYRAAAARIRELIVERDSFYVEYRMRCDAETKVAHARAESAERQLAELRARCAELTQQWYDGKISAAALAERIDRAIAPEPDEYMCPNCVTPWKCNGPHIPESGALAPEREK